MSLSGQRSVSLSAQPSNPSELNEAPTSRAVLSLGGWVRLLSLVVVVLFAKDLARWTWSLLKPSVTSVSVLPSKSAPMIPFHISTIFSARFFGSAPLSQSDIAGSLPVSGLNLTLSGVVAAGARSIALVSVDGRPAEPFSVGQAIINGVTLKSVHPDRIVIERGGTAETVLLGNPSDNLTGISRVPMDNSGVRSIGNGRYEISREALQGQIRSAGLLDQASITPSESGGLKVNSVRSGSVLEKIGLKAGQTIQSINGQPLQSMDNVMSAYQKLSNGGKIELEVMQDGRTETLSYDVH